MASPRETNLAAYTDSQSQNENSRASQLYSDLDLFFGTKAASKDINKVNDIQAVKRSVRNLILMNHYEKPFHPEIGSGVRDVLFDNMSPMASHILTRKIEMVIDQFEPRARLISVTAHPNLDRNEYECTIQFYVVNAPTELVDLTVFLERLR